MAIYLAEIKPFIFLRPYIWRKSTLFYSMAICLAEMKPLIFYGHIFGGNQFSFLLWPYIWWKSTFISFMAIYLAEVNPFIFLRPYIWRRCWSFPIGNLSPLPLHCSMLTLMADWWWSLTTGHDDIDDGDDALHWWKEWRGNWDAYYCIVREIPILHLFDILC